MANDFLTNCCKWLGGSVHAIFMLCGILLMTLGGLTITNQSMYKDMITNGFMSVPALIIIIGFVVFVVYLLGCQGAFKESHRTLIAFCVLLSFICLLEFSGAIAAYVYRNNVEGKFNETVAENFKNYSNDTKITRVWDTMQKSLHCCGATGAKDYEDILHTKIADSCCKIDVCVNMTLDNSFNVSCTEKIEHELKANASIVGAVTITIAFIQLLGILWGVNMARRFSRGYESV